MAEADGSAAVEDLAHLLARVASLRRAVAWDTASFELPDLHVVAAIVRQHQPEDPPAAPVSQDALHALGTWAEGRGIQLARGLRLIAAATGARVEATGPIPQGSVLARVPVAAMVRDSWILRQHPTLAPWLDGQPLFGPGTLMLWLVCARWGGGPPDPFAPYVAALPGVAPATALSWPRSPGSHLVAADLGRRFLAGVLQLYCLVQRRLLHTPPEARPIRPEALTLERWLWAGAILSSRQTGLPEGLALVPVWDLLDHDESLGQGTTDLVGDALVCAAGADYAPGDRVRTYTGRRTPTERWVYGGFIPPGPPDGEPAALPFPVPAGVPLRREKLVWVLSHPDAPVEVPIRPGDLDAALRRARWYALDADDLAHLGAGSVADLWDQDLALGAAGEARARAILHSWLYERAGADAIEPFDTNHAAMLAAARAFYRGLVPG